MKKSVLTFRIPDAPERATWHPDRTECKNTSST
jgi:hypothetical protein